MFRMPRVYLRFFLSGFELLLFCLYLCDIFGERALVHTVRVLWYRTGTDQGSAFWDTAFICNPNVRSIFLKIVSRMFRISSRCVVLARSPQALPA